VVCTGEAAAQAAETAAGPSADTADAAAAAAPAPEEEGDSIDPEFLAALPPEIQAEVLEQQRRERRMRERQRQQQQAAAAAAQVSIKPCMQRCVSHKLLHHQLVVSVCMAPLHCQEQGKSS